MNRYKEVSDLIDQLAIVCDNKREDDCDEKTCYRCQAEFLIDAGYRKADEVRKETAKEVYKRVDKWLDEIVPHTKEWTILFCLLGWIKTEYGVEVDE